MRNVIGLDILRRQNSKRLELYVVARDAPVRHRSQDAEFLLSLGSESEQMKMK